MDILWYKMSHEIPMTRVSWIISWVHFKIHGNLLAFSWYQKLLVDPSRYY